MTVLSNCDTLSGRRGKLDRAEGRSMNMKEDSRVLKLQKKAVELGASDAKIISVDRIPVEDEVVEMCKAHLCRGYGKSANCPPHVMGPGQAREWIEKYETALFFKIDVSPQALLSEDRFKTFKTVYMIASKLETSAREEGFPLAKGLAAGSCKPVFCKGRECDVLMDEGECRYPSLARPSMEAVGINVFKLSKDVGWDIYLILKASDPDTVPKGMLAGLVLLS
jgi:predicted metal-binding protein